MDEKETVRQPEAAFAGPQQPEEQPQGNNAPYQQPFAPPIQPPYYQAPPINKPYKKKRSLFEIEKRDLLFSVCALVLSLLLRGSGEVSTRDSPPRL